MRVIFPHTAVVAAGLLFLAPLLGCSDEAPLAPDETTPTPLVLALTTASNDAPAAADALAAVLGRPVEASFHETPAQAREALRRGKAHIAALDAWTFYEAHVDDDAQLVAPGAEPATARWYVPASSNAGRLEDLEGQRIAFTSPDSAGGFLLPLAALSEAGLVGPAVSVDDAFDRPFYSGSAEASLAALLEGRVEAAPLPDDLADARLRPLGPPWTTPAPVIAARADLPLRTVARFREALGQTGAHRALFDLPELAAADVHLLQPIQDARRRTGVRLPQ